MSEDLLDKMALSMELNVLNKPLLVFVSSKLFELPICGASTSHTLEEFEGEISDRPPDEPSPKKAKTGPHPDQGEQERDSTEPRSSQNAEAAPSSEEASPGLAPEPLLQNAPIPGDDDDESEQPTIAADNTITQPPTHDVQSLSPNFPGVSFAERRRQQERQETSWLRTPLWPLARDHPDPESPGKPRRARHHESVNIAVELFRKMAAKAQPTFQPDGTMIRKHMRFTLGPQQIFGL